MIPISTRTTWRWPCYSTDDGGCAFSHSDDFSRDEKNELFETILLHPDLLLNNIMIDPNTLKITGIIDWECTNASTKWQDHHDSYLSSVSWSWRGTGSGWTRRRIFTAGLGGLGEYVTQESLWRGCWTHSEVEEGIYILCPHGGDDAN